MKTKGKILIFIILALMLIATVAQASVEESKSTEPEVEIIREITELRELTSKTYEMADGTYKYVGYTDNIHYIDDSGKLADISTAFVTSNKYMNGATCKYENSANSFDILISDMADTKYPITLKNGECAISFGINNAKNVSSERYNSNNNEILNEFIDKDSSIVFNNVIDDIDLIYESSTHGIKEYIVLNSIPKTNIFEFNVKVSGVMLQKSDNDTYEFVDSQGTSIFTVSNLFAIDSNKEVTEKVNCNFSETEEGYILQIIVDENYLNDSARAYPVIVDPSVLISSSSTPDSFVASKYSTTNYNSGSNMDYLRTGRDDYYYTRRSFIKFSIPSTIPPDSVTSAYLTMRKSSGATPDLHAYMVTGSWSSSSITWANKPSYTTLYASGNSYNFTQYSSSAWYKMNVTTMVRRWVDGDSTNYGMCVRDDTESGTSQWTTFYSSDASSPNKPELIIYYSGDSILDYWESDGYIIARWSNTPYVYNSKLNTNTSFYFTESESHARSQWSAASVATYTTSSSSTDDIEIYGGTIAQLEATGLFSNIPTNYAGLCFPHSNYEKAMYYNGDEKDCRLMYYSLIGIIDRGYSLNSQKGVTTHELSHALGWTGHSSDISDVMYYAAVGNYILTTDEINHLKQVY